MDNLAIIKNDSFKKNIVRLYFPYDFEPGKSLNGYVACSLLTMFNNKYKESDEFTKALIDNYIYGITYSAPALYKQGFFCFKMVIPSEKALGEKVLEKAFSMLRDVIYDPKLVSGAFDPDDIKREIDIRKNNIGNLKKKINEVTGQRVYNEIDSEFFGNTTFNHPEYLDAVTAKSAYDYYFKYIGSKSPYVCYLGDVDSKLIESLYKKYFTGKPVSKYDNEKTFYYDLFPSPKYIEESGNYNQSEVLMVYKVQDMKKEDELYLDLVSRLLSDQSSFMLHNTLRTKYNLVYSTGSYPFVAHGLLFCVALISKENKDKAIDAIKEVIEDIKNEELIAPKLALIKEKMKIELVKDLDDMMTLINDKMNKYFDIDCSKEEYFEKANKVTAAELASFARRLKLDITCFNGGEK